MKRARYILIPLSDETRGHQSYNRAVLWKNHLLELLHISEPRGGPLLELDQNDSVFRKSNKWRLNSSGFSIIRKWPVPEISTYCRFG